VNVLYDEIESGRVHVDVGYLILGTNDPRNLVFPFYTIPDEEIAGTTLPAELGV
jgi:hypothetical protein